MRGRKREEVDCRAREMLSFASTYAHISSFLGYASLLSGQGRLLLSSRSMLSTHRWDSLSLPILKYHLGPLHTYSVSSSTNEALLVFNVSLDHSTIICGHQSSKM
jgi:hypothetical protein